MISHVTNQSLRVGLTKMLLALLMIDFTSVISMKAMLWQKNYRFYISNIYDLFSLTWFCNSRWKLFVWFPKTDWSGLTLNNKRRINVVRKDDFVGWSYYKLVCVHGTFVCDWHVEKQIHVKFVAYNKKVFDVKFHFTSLSFQNITRSISTIVDVLDDN